MIIGTALGWSDRGTIALAVALAFLFGYTLTSIPLLHSGLALGAVIPIALASDTISIAIMEVVDNAIILLIPGAMEAGLDSIGFYAALTFALIVAGAAAFPVNRCSSPAARVTPSCTSTTPPDRGAGRRRPLPPPAQRA